MSQCDHLDQSNVAAHSSLNEECGNSHRAPLQGAYHHEENIVWSLAIWACSASLLIAQTIAQVQKADLAIPFGTVSGKIVMAGDHLVFIDEERPDQSFVVARNDVKDLIIQDTTASLELRRPVQDRSGERSRLNFRLASGETVSLKRWFGSA
jgi:hypothetical protein